MENLFLWCVTEKDQAGLKPSLKALLHSKVDVLYFFPQFFFYQPGGGGRPFLSSTHFPEYLDKALRQNFAQHEMGG